MEGSLHKLRCTIWHLPILFEHVTLTCVPLDAHSLGHCKERHKGKKTPYSVISWSSICKARSSFSQTECKMEAAFRTGLLLITWNVGYLSNLQFWIAKTACENTPGEVWCRKTSEIKETCLFLELLVLPFKKRTKQCSFSEQKKMADKPPTWVAF